MIHSARPATISRSSLASKGASGVLAATVVSGERKEDVLKRAVGQIGPCPQVGECPLAANATVGKQHDPIADLFGIAKLMDR